MRALWALWALEGALSLAGFDFWLLASMQDAAGAGTNGWWKHVAPWAVVFLLVWLLKRLC